LGCSRRSGLQARRRRRRIPTTNGLRYLPGVTTLELDAEKCTGCGLCLEVCPHAVLARDNGHVRIADRDACMECGACQRNCPAEAVTVQAGVGCATALLKGVVSGEAECGCGGKKSACCG
jgi:NAD-dependent dihydropyrimidine dehydrogenase PreA subunit